MGTNAVLSPWETTSALIQHPASTSKEPPESKWGEGCAPNSAPPSSISNRKRPKRESVGTVDLRGVTAVGDASPQTLQTVATDLLRLPYPALDHFHPLGGPAKTLDRRQLRVRRGTKWTLFRKNNQERALYTSDTSIQLWYEETISEQLLKTFICFWLECPSSAITVLSLEKKKTVYGGKAKKDWGLSILISQLTNEYRHVCL